MRIAIVGGGNRCRELMNMFKLHEFREISPRIVAVADTDTHSSCVAAAIDSEIFVTHDYNDLMDRDDIDLIIELTDDLDVYNDILKKKKPTVRAVAAGTAQLFWELSRVSLEKAKARQELHETRAMFKALFNDLIQEGVMVIGYDYRILDINQAMLDSLGLKKTDVVGKPCYKVTHHRNHPCSGDLHPCPLIQTLETEKPSKNTHVHMDKDGKEMYISLSTYPLIENDDVIGAIEISRDITADIKMQKLVMEQEKLASIGRLAAGVAHEINNPMTTILTSAMLIQEELDGSDPNFDELQTIVDETLRCRKIVTSLLDFARQNKPSRRPVDVSALIAESIILTQKQAAFKDVTVTQALQDDLPQVSLDKGQIQQALINLILNGVDACNPGGRIDVAAALSADGQLLVIRVSDNGIGIEPRRLSSIFDPFFTTKETGNGLGLAITHGIIEQHGGSIEVDSLPGKGATFTIRIPLQNGETDGA